MERDPRPGKLAKHLSELYSYHNAAMWILQNKGMPHLMAVYYHFIDWICHDFMEYSAPRRPEITETDFRLYKNVVDAAYQLQDILLRELLNAAGPQTNLLLVSDHGFLSGDERPQRTPRVTAGIAAWHRPQGMLAAAGPLFQSAASLQGARLIDVAPTILHAFGLPVGADMPGRVLTKLLRSDASVRTLPSWDTEGPPLSASLPPPLSEDSNQALLQQFADLGYISLADESLESPEDMNDRENAWNMGVALLKTGRYEEALPFLELAAFHQPEAPHIALPLARCQAALGLATEAEQTIQLFNDYGVDNLQAQQSLLEIYLDLKRFDECVRGLNHLRTRFPSNTELPLKIGVALLRQEDFAAAETLYREILQTRPTCDQAALGLARALLRQQRYDASWQALERVLQTNQQLPLVWFTAGQILEHDDNTEEAIEAYEKALELMPELSSAQHRLSQLRREQRVADGAFVPFTLPPDIGFDELARRQDPNTPVLRTEALREAASQRALARLQQREAARAAQAPITRIDAPQPKDQAPIVIVTGLPRSGTSLMMQMLHRGGLAVQADEQRPADHNNPKGYFEWEVIKTLEQTPDAIDAAAGKAVKVVSLLLQFLPKDRRYDFIWMERPIDEVHRSQQSMLKNLGSSSEAAAKTLASHCASVLTQLETQWCQDTRFARLLKIPYYDCIGSPEATAAKVAEFLPQHTLDTAAMVSCIDPSLHRSKL